MYGPELRQPKEGAEDMVNRPSTFSARRVLAGVAIGIPVTIGLVVILGLIWGCGESETEAKYAPRYAPSQTVSEIVSPADLVIAYGRNEVAADIRFKDKIIIVVGQIETIGKRRYSGPYVALLAAGFSSVECMFTERDIPQLSQLQPRQTVRIRGRCDGCPYSDIELRECELVW